MSTENGECNLDFGAEAHAKSLPEEGWHHARVLDPRISDKGEVVWLSIRLALDRGHRVDDVICISADPNGKFASRVNEGRRRVSKYLNAGERATKFNHLIEMEAALDGADIEVNIRWRDPDFPVPIVRDIRKPQQPRQATVADPGADSQDD